MQTFLPYPDFDESARVLDDKRLGKQRVENLQIMSVLERHRVTGMYSTGKYRVEAFDPRGWVNHPAVRMWRGHECSLLVYQAAICDEWTRRGFQDTCMKKTAAIHQARCNEGWEFLGEHPSWFGDEALHLSHRSNLVRKDPERYGPMFPDVRSDLEYVWPV